MILYTNFVVIISNINTQPIDIGDVIVFKITDREIPIVHRVVEVNADEYGNQVIIISVFLH